MDEELSEKFRELTMHLERIESDQQMLHMSLDGIDAAISLLRDELTMPSGKVTQRFSKLEEQIRQLSGAKSVKKRRAVSRA